MCLHGRSRLLVSYHRARIREMIWVSLIRIDCENSSTQIFNVKRNDSIFAARFFEIGKYTENQKFITDNFIMTKAEIVNEIADKTGLDKVEVLTTVEAFMNSVKNSLARDENVYLRGFGSFIVKERAEKTGRNISKNTTIIIPAHNIPSFKPAKTFVDKVKKNVNVK